MAGGQFKGKDMSGTLEHKSVRVVASNPTISPSSQRQVPSVYLASVSTDPEIVCSGLRAPVDVGFLCFGDAVEGLNGCATEPSEGL